MDKFTEDEIKELLSKSNYNGHVTIDGYTNKTILNKIHEAIKIYFPLKDVTFTVLDKNGEYISKIDKGREIHSDHLCKMFQDMGLTNVNVDYCIETILK